MDKIPTPEDRQRPAAIQESLWKVEAGPGGSLTLFRLLSDVVDGGYIRKVRVGEHADEVAKTIGTQITAACSVYIDPTGENEPVPALQIFAPEPMSEATEELLKSEVDTIIREVTQPAPQPVG